MDMIKRSDDPVAPGRDVEIVGTAMSGSMGVVEEYVEQKGRWKVKFASGVAKNFKAENLCVVKVKKVKAPKACTHDSTGQPEAQAEPVQDKSEVTKDSGSNGAAADAAYGSNKADAEPAEDSSSGASKASKPISSQMASSLTETLERLGRESKLEGSESQGVAVQAEQAISTMATECPSAEIPDEPHGVNLAGRHFPDHKVLTEHVRAIQAKLDAAGEAHDRLEGEDCFLLFHLVLATQCTRIDEKLQTPLRYIRYAKAPNFSNKCFILELSDGTQEPISATKCIKELFGMKVSKSSNKRSRDVEEIHVEQNLLQKRSRTEPQERPRAETGLKLIGEVLAEQKHTQAGRWEYFLKDEARRCFAGYFSSPLPHEQLLDFYEKVREGTTWESPLDPRSGEPIPRKTAWMVMSSCTCTYRYGGVDVSPQKYPPWMYELMEAYMPLCGLTERDQWPDSCNLNWYKDGSMSVGWHADDEKLFQGRQKDIRIISVSLGHTRTFELRLDDLESENGSREKHVIRLSNGDLCTMEGLAQKYYQHRVPKEQATGPRINLTWRWVKQHKADCPARATGVGSEA